MRWAGLAVATLGGLLVSCSLDPSLTCGASCGDAGDAATPDAPKDSPGPDAPATTDAPSDGPVDSPTPTDAPCSTSCPQGTTCNGSFCSVPQGPACGAAPPANGGSGAFDGTVCGGSGPTVVTTCTSPTTGSASFLDFTTNGDPWNVTVKAVDGPLQIEVMSSGCASGSACYDLAAGDSTVILVQQNTVIAIVNGSGTSCTSWQITYVSQ
jgi:hypothetical protein